MKITRLGGTRPLLTIGSIIGGGTTEGATESPAPSGHVPTSNGSNGVSWGSNVATITANGSNLVLGPFVNFAAGSNIILAVSSNTINIAATGGGSVSYGSNSNQVSYANAPGASTDSSRADHVHLGVTSVAHSSNTYSGPVILAPGTNMAITSPSSGTFTLHSTATGGSGSSGVTVQDEGTPLSTTGTTLNFVGAGVAATGTGATKTITIAGASGGFYLDGLTLHGTHGDEFAGSSLAGIWTPRGVWDSEAIQFGVGGTWLQAILSASQAHSIFQTMPSKETFEIIVAMSSFGTGINIIGPAIVGSTGTGVGVAFRPDETVARLENLASYAYTSAGTNLAGVGAIGTKGNGQKIWWSLRRVQTALSGDVYVARYSLDGFTWSKELSHTPATFTPTQIGWGRLYGTVSGEVMGIDRFNVVEAYDQGSNLVITPTSGTPTYSASSAFAGFGASRAADGTANDWALNSGTTDTPPYWQVAWSVGQDLNRVLIKERGGDTFGVGHLEMVNGSGTTKVAVRSFMGGVSTIWHVVDFPTVTGVTSLRVVSDLGAGANGGFTEVEAYLRS